MKPSARKCASSGAALASIGLFALGLAVLTVLSRHDRMTAAGLSFLALAGVFASPELIRDSRVTQFVRDGWVMTLLVAGSVAVGGGIALLAAGWPTPARASLQAGLVIVAADAPIALASFAVSGRGWGSSRPRSTLARADTWIFRRRHRWQIAAGLFLFGTLLQFVALVRA